MSFGAPRGGVNRDALKSALVRVPPESVTGRYGPICTCPTALLDVRVQHKAARERYWTAGNINSSDSITGCQVFNVNLSESVTGC